MSVETRVIVQSQAPAVAAAPNIAFHLQLENPVKRLMAEIVGAAPNKQLLEIWHQSFCKRFSFPLKEEERLEAVKKLCYLYFRLVSTSDAKQKIVALIQTLLPKAETIDKVFGDYKKVVEAQKILDLELHYKQLEAKLFQEAIAVDASLEEQLAKFKGEMEMALVRLQGLHQTLLERARALKEKVVRLDQQVQKLKAAQAVVESQVSVSVTVAVAHDDLVAELKE